MRGLQGNRDRYVRRNRKEKQMKYKGKEVKFIKDYGNWILVENEEGWKEGIHKHDLGLIKEPIKPVYNLKPEKVVYMRRRHR